MSEYETLAKILAESMKTNERFEELEKKQKSHGEIISRLDMQRAALARDVAALEAKAKEHRCEPGHCYCPDPPKPSGWRAREWKGDHQTTIVDTDIVEAHPRAVRVRMHRPKYEPSSFGICDCHTGKWSEQAWAEHAEFLQISSEPAP